MEHQFYAYLSVPVGLGLVLLGLYGPTKRIKFLKYEFSSGSLLIVCGIILILLAFPVAQFIAGLKSAVLKSNSIPPNLPTPPQ